MTEIYKMYTGKLTPAWFALSEAEKKSMGEELDHVREEAGGKIVVQCISHWASEQNHSFGVEVFPSIEAVQKHGKLLFELDWPKYYDGTTVLGIDVADA